MTHDEISRAFNEASAFARKGDWDRAANLYHACLMAAQGQDSPYSGDSLAQFVRSAAINLAQLQVRKRQFTEALRLVDLALKNRPTAFGTALALATKGVALCGARDLVQGLPIIDQALKAQPIHGALTAADLIIDLLDHPCWYDVRVSESALPQEASIVNPVARVVCMPLSAIPYPVEVSTVVPNFEVRKSELTKGVDLLSYAEQLVLGVMEQSREKDVLGDAYEHLGRIKIKCGNREEARKLLQKAREIGSPSGDPDRHLADLDRRESRSQAAGGGPWSRLFRSRLK